MNSEISTNNDDIDPLLSLDQQQQQIRNPNPKRRKHNRVRTGCFTCRKRKKKCDEHQPNCENCIRNKLKCQYPSQWNEALPLNFKLETFQYDELVPLHYKRKKISTNLKSQKVPQDLFGVFLLNTSSLDVSNSNRKNNGIPAIGETVDTENVEKEVIDTKLGNSTSYESVEIVTQSPIKSLSSTPSTSLSLLTHNDNQAAEHKTIEVDHPDNALSWVFTGPVTNLHLFGKYIPNIELSPQDAELYVHCARDFMQQVSLPHAHPSLSPPNVWVNLVLESSILIDVYLSCGATYLACLHQNLKVDPLHEQSSQQLQINDNAQLSQKYRELSEIKYNLAVKSLMLAISTNSIDLDSDWLMTAGLSLCLRDRANGLNGSRCTKHVSFVYNLIKRRIDKKRQSQSLGNALPLLSLITPVERLLIDSFLFNYTCSLLTCGKQDYASLPSPYSFFPDIENWFDAPIVQNCEVKWMNNPVLGAARNSFQTLAKLIYLLRSHYEFDGDADDNSHYTNDETFWELILALNDQEIDQVEKDNVLKLNQLLKIFPLGSKTMVTSHTGEQLSYSVLRSNLAVSIITIHACKILAAKLINPKIPAYLPEIQHLVSIILEELSLYIPQDNYSSSICIASLFFCGVAIINKPQQGLLCYKLSNLKNNLSQIVANNLISILKKCWDRETTERAIFGDKCYKCFDTIFDREILESVAF